MKRTTEAAVLKACLNYCRLINLFVWRTNNTGIYDAARKAFRTFHGMKGVADILGCTNEGRLLAIEVKKPGGKIRKEQVEFLDAVRQRGGLAVVAYSVSDLQAALKAEGVIE